MSEAFKTGNNSDPCDVLHAALEKVGVYAHYKEITPISSANSRREDADRAFIYFTSAYHRRLASGELRKALAVEKTTGVLIRDVFEKTSLAEAHHLANVGFYWKRTDAIEKFRVIIFCNKPKLLTAKGSKRYVEISFKLLKNDVKGLAKK